MSNPISRRDVIKQLGGASAGVVLTGGIIRGQSSDIMVGGRPVEIVVASLTGNTVRLTVLPLTENQPASVPLNGGLAQPNEA